MKFTGIRPDKPERTLGIRPDTFDGQGEKIEEQLESVIQQAVLGPDGINRVKRLTERMDALGLTGEEKVGLVARAMQEAGFFNVVGQLDVLERLVEELEVKP